LNRATQSKILWAVIGVFLLYTCGSWVWLQGGGYFGVPFSNFVPGWFLTVYIFLQIFALYLYRFSNAPVESRVIKPKTFWYQALAAYGIIALGRVALAFVGKNVQVTDPTGRTWMTGDIYDTQALVTIFTMVFIVVLSAIRITRRAVGEQTQKGYLVPLARHRGCGWAYSKTLISGLRRAMHHRRAE
jgi:hypothetical protein